MPMMSARVAFQSKKSGLVAAFVKRAGQSATATYDNVTDACYGSDGSLYVLGSYSQAYIIKYGPTGTLLWQRKFSYGVTGYNRICVDPSGNVFVTSGNNCVVKYNSSGTLQWQKQYSVSGSGTSTYSVGADSSGNAYVVGQYGDGAAYATGFAYVAKLDSSGASQWVRGVANGWSGVGFSSNNYNLDSVTDSAGTTYICGSGGYSTGVSYAYVAAINSSGTVLWHNVETAVLQTYRRITLSGSTVCVIGTEGSGAIHVCRYAASNGAYSRGDKFTMPGAVAGVTADSSGNVYMSSSSSANKTLVMRVNSSGGIDWQRTIGATAGSDYSGSFPNSGLDVTAAGNLLIASVHREPSTAGCNIMAAVVYTDGTGTGTIGATTYATSTEGTATGSSSLTNSLVSRNYVTGGIGPSNSSGTDAAGDLVEV